VEKMGNEAILNVFIVIFIDENTTGTKSLINKNHIDIIKLSIKTI